tara:strand:+ start:444 stop:1262 length:819 start_codon:yes stop_codon:yes gene_type:complete
MISVDEYNKKWVLELVKHKKEEYSFINFFGEFEYNVSNIGSGGFDLKKLEKLNALMNDKPIPKEKIKKEKKPKDIIIKSRKIWVEGTRDNFSMYLYDNNSKSEDENDKKYYFRSEHYSGYTKNSISKKVGKKQPTFYSLRYSKDGYPIIFCNQTNIPKKYFILSGNKYEHTNDIKKAIRQSVKNFYFFADDITKKKIKKYEDQQRKIKLEKLRLKKEAEEAAAFKAKIIKFSIIGISIILIMIVVYFVFLRKPGKKNKMLVNYVETDDDDDE